jgi:hypothetical protein
MTLNDKLAFYIFFSDYIISHSSIYKFFNSDRATYTYIICHELFIIMYILFGWTFNLIFVFTLFVFYLIIAIFITILCGHNDYIFDNIINYIISLLCSKVFYIMELWYIFLLILWFVCISPFYLIFVTLELLFRIINKFCL